MQRGKVLPALFQYCYHPGQFGPLFRLFLHAPETEVGDHHGHPLLTRVSERLWDYARDDEGRAPTRFVLFQPASPDIVSKETLVDSHT